MQRLATEGELMTQRESHVPQQSKIKIILQNGQQGTVTDLQTNDLIFYTNHDHQTIVFLFQNTKDNKLIGRQLQGGCAEIDLSSDYTLKVQAANGTEIFELIKHQHAIAVETEQVLTNYLRRVAGVLRNIVTQRKDREALAAFLLEK